MAPRVSPSKRKHAETGRTIRQQTLLSGARVTRGTAPQTQEGTKMPVSKELASLSTPQPGADRPGLRSASGLATQSIVMRKANAATQGASNSVTAAPAAARSRTPAAATKPSEKQQQQPYAGQCRHLAHATIDEETFRVGDNVYVVLDTQLVAGILSDDDKDDCVCLVCGDGEKEARVMLECDRCLAGCHLGCLSPPLTDVPEGEWVCPGCKAGRAPAARPPCTARDCLLQRHGLGLARIESIWQEPNGDMQCVYRWYCLPEETHTGRQRHHLAREMFLTQLRDSDSMDAILRAAHVLDPHAFGKGGCSELGEDVFVCEYLYDSAWQRFRRRTEFGDSDSEDEGEEWAPEGQDAGSDGECEGLQPEHMPGKVRTNKKSVASRKGKNGRKQGGQEYLEQVGALEVPQHARQRQREGSSALSQARSVLALTSVPRTLPCRETERGQVAAFVEEVLAEDCGKCLYISGIPGTGKTATVLEVMRGLKRKSEARKLPQFQFVEINGLRLASPQHAYSALYEALTGDRAGPQTAATALEEMFSGNGSGKNGKGARRPTILLIDEMDQLVNKTQTVLYNLFDWPGRKTSRLSIIGIANTMDLPERLHPRIGSRLAGRRVVFQPYSRDQLNEIIKSRLDGLAAFQPNALEFISRKVANCSGDVRRCLELCRRAAEIAEDKQHRQQQQQQRAGPGSSGGANDSTLQQERGMVEMRHVAAAIAEMFNTGHVRLLREACRLERLVLAAIYLETSSSGRAECLLGDVWERLRVLCSQNCEAQRYDFGSVLERAAELGAKRLIICDPAVRRLRAKVALNVAVNDLTMMLTTDAELPWLALAISRAAMAPMATLE